MTLNPTITGRAEAKAQNPMEVRMSTAIMSDSLSARKAAKLSW